MVGLTCYFHSCSNNLLAQTNFTSNFLESCGKKILSSSHHYYMNLMVDQSLGNLREKKNLICSSVTLQSMCSKQQRDMFGQIFSCTRDYSKGGLFRLEFVLTYVAGWKSVRETIKSHLQETKGDQNLKQKETFRRPIIVEKETF